MFIQIMVEGDGVSITNILQKREELYDLEEQFRNEPLSNWFDGLIPEINSRLRRKPPLHRAIKRTLADFKEEINKINAIVKEIGILLLKRLLPSENLEKNYMENVFGPPNRIYMEEVHQAFCRMIEAMNEFRERVTECEAQFKRLTYNGKENEIEKIIRHITDYHPTSATVSGTTIRQCNNKAHAPLKQLPEINGRNYYEFLICVEVHYNRYQRKRLNGHEFIQQKADEILHRQFLDGLGL